MKYKKELQIIFIIFLCGSFFGYVLENVLTTLKGVYVLRQGLIYEPLIPIYGIGALVFYFLLTNIHLKHKNKVLNYLFVFFISFIFGGLIEYTVSFIQEKIFGTISWDYTYLPFNINGRTSLFHATYWGIIGVLYYIFIIPIINKIKYKNFSIYTDLLIVILCLITIFDISISMLACYRRTERRNGIDATNKIERFLDKYYPDEIIDYYFSNAKTKK